MVSKDEIVVLHWVRIGSVATCYWANSLGLENGVMHLSMQWWSRHDQSACCVAAREVRRKGRTQDSRPHSGHFVIKVCLRPASSFVYGTTIDLAYHLVRLTPCHTRHEGLEIVYSPSNLATTVLISSSPYIRNPFSFVTLANCTFLESSFSSMTCFSVFSTRVSASSRVSDRWYSDCNSAWAPSLPDPMALASYL